jgi:signal recognition particle receptor subunit beta
MVQINFAQKQVNAKIVYYGPGMSGKTTNLEIVHQRAPTPNKGELTSISTDGDRTLFFDFMPLDLGTVAGMRTCFQLYTVPGQVYYNSTRKLVLQGVDGVVFVADSSASMVEENLESMRNLEQNLAEYGKSLAQLPLIIQYNKRDLPDALSVDELNKILNPYNAPFFEAIANTGQGVFPTLKALAARVLETIHTGGRGAAASASAGASVSSGQTGFHTAPKLPNAGQQRPLTQTGFHQAQAAAQQARSQAPAPMPMAPAAHAQPQPMGVAPAHAEHLARTNVHPPPGMAMPQPLPPIPQPVPQQLHQTSYAYAQQQQPVAAQQHGHAQQQGYAQPAYGQPMAPHAQAGGPSMMGQQPGSAPSQLMMQPPQAGQPAGSQLRVAGPGDGGHGSHGASSHGGGARTAKPAGSSDGAKPRAAKPAGAKSAAPRAASPEGAAPRLQPRGTPAPAPMPTPSGGKKRLLYVGIFVVIALAGGAVAAKTFLSIF